MLTEDDLNCIRLLLNEQNKRFDHMDERLDKMDERLDKMDERLDKMDERLDKMDERLDKMDERLDKMDARFDQMDARMDGMEDYMHKKFAMIENDLIPKVNALYEMTDLYVRQRECRERHDGINEKLEYIEPLIEVTKSNNELLRRQEEIIKQLLRTA